MKSSRLRETASSQRRWICCGSPAVCITSSRAWVPRLDCSSHWVQNVAHGGGRVGRRAGVGLVLVSVDDISVPLLAGRTVQAIVSTAMAIPSPPPTQSAATPRRPPVCFSPLRRVTRSRAPLQPIGWPRAHGAAVDVRPSPAAGPAPCSAASGTAANASLTSNRSTSATVQPTLSSSFLMAPTGAIVNHSGSRLKDGGADDPGPGLQPQRLGTSPARRAGAPRRRR